MNIRKIRREFMKFDGFAMNDWLWLGLKSVYSSPEPRKIIELGHIGSLDIKLSVSDTLYYVYEKFLPKAKREMFRRAIGEVLRNHCNDNDASVEIFRDLICLMAMTKAAESLDALYPVFGNELIGKRCPSLIYEAIYVLGFFPPTALTHKTILQLVYSNNFDESYLLAVIKVFAKCNPPLAINLVQQYMAHFQYRYEAALKREEMRLYKELMVNITQLMQALVP